MNSHSTRRRFLHTTLATGVAASAVGRTIDCLAGAGSNKQSRSGTSIDVGTRKQLFIDKLFFDTSEGITLEIEPPRKTGDNILTKEHPWESVEVNWFNVIEDTGRIDKQAKYRMWYEAYDLDGWDSGDDTSFCYAESRDGIHWTKPKLGLFSYRRSTKNNILFRQIGSNAHGNRSRVHGTGVFIDPTAPPNARYKAVGQGIYTGLGSPPHRIAGMVSADGLKWHRYSRPICPVFADSQYSGFWDKSLKKYVIYGRVSGRGRAIGRSVSEDFSRIDPLKLVAQTDDRDPADSDLYNPAALKYQYAEGVYLMFPSLYQHRLDTLDIHLAVSRDGVHWSRPSRDVPFVSRGGAGAFDRNTLYMGQGMLRVGDELWMYYSGSPLKHGEFTRELLKKPENARICSRVVARIDRFVAATADSRGGQFTTPPLKFSGKRLKLNVKVGDGGSVRVGLLDKNGKSIANRSVDNCLAITGDHVGKTVEWKGGSDVGGRASVPTRLRAEMKNARLFAFATD